MELLLSWNANPNLCDMSSVYPLHLSAFDETGSTICVSLLLDAKAEVNVKTRGITI